ncbi:MAG: hypothetical protein LBT86_07215 [Deltaproteobacteria bacterium]|jgi:hypothetical protein|nr:hypothetical protein [Deltaproteobacteria bacterium]
MGDNKTKNDYAWEVLFKRHNILSRVDAEGSFCISSSLINVEREARLMSKFDKSTHLPEIFRENQLSILPISRGDYLIGPFVTHEPLDYKPIKPKQVSTIPNL